MSHVISPLSSEHDRSAFSSGVASLDNYFRTQVSQDLRKKLAACFVITDTEGRIAGYYTLSGYSIALEEIPETLKKKIPRAYRSLPAILLGRLAVDKKKQGLGFGEQMLIDAFKRSLDISTMLGSFALIVDPIDSKAISFYQKYGFESLSTGRMFLSMKTIETSFS